MQKIRTLGPGETIYISPDAETLGAVRIRTSEGIHITEDFRTLLGLPGHHWYI
jgi:hypothetical protein